MRLFGTGRAGSIGAAEIRQAIRTHSVVNLDSLDYAGNLESLRDVQGRKRYSREIVDICDSNGIVGYLKYIDLTVLCNSRQNLTLIVRSINQ